MILSPTLPMAETPPSMSSTTATGTSNDGRSEKAGPTATAAVVGTPQKVERGKQVWIQVGLRGVFFLTGAALLGLTGYIAGTAGAVHIEKVYAAVLAAVSPSPIAVSLLHPAD